MPHHGMRRDFPEQRPLGRKNIAMEDANNPRFQLAEGGLREADHVVGVDTAADRVPCLVIDESTPIKALDKKRRVLVTNGSIAARTSSLVGSMAAAVAGFAGLRASSGRVAETMGAVAIPRPYDGPAVICHPLRFIRERTMVKTQDPKTGQTSWDFGPEYHTARHAANRGNGALVKRMARQIAASGN